MKRILVIIIAIVGLSIPTMAQRLLPHQKGIEFYGGVPLQKHNTFGDGNFNAGFNFTRYIRNYHYYHFGLNYLQQNYHYNELKVPVRDYMGEGGFMFHLISSPGKSFLVYGGPCLSLGYEEVNDSKKWLPDGAYLKQETDLFMVLALNCLWKNSLRIMSWFLLKPKEHSFSEQIWIYSDLQY